MIRSSIFLRLKKAFYTTQPQNIVNFQNLCFENDILKMILISRLYNNISKTIISIDIIFEI